MNLINIEMRYMKTTQSNTRSKWMELENIILSEINQAQKTSNRMFFLICGL
jgi:hypothetical protein